MCTAFGLMNTRRLSNYINAANKTSTIHQHSFGTANSLFSFERQLCTFA